MYQKYIKRILDIIISLFVLIIFSPMYLCIAFLVRIKLGKPVIFKQKRPGMNEKIFTLYKFRTMTDEKDENGNLLPDEKRLTKFGKFLRSTSLDELPEFFNILKGEMSLIGPRPLVVSYLPYYNDKEKHRHDVRPGLTGLAQINGRNNLNWEERFAYDVQYVNNITFFNDIKIFFCTFFKVLKKSDVSVRGTGKTIDFDKYRKAQCLQKVEKEDMNKIAHFFQEIKYYMGNSVLQGHMGEAYTDNINNPTFAFLFVRAYCFIGGDANSENARFALKILPDSCKVIIADERWNSVIENVFENNFQKSKRFSMKKESNIFDKKKLQEYIENLNENYIIKDIDEKLYNLIQETDSYVTNLGMTDNYLEKGLGVCCLKNNEIVGVVTSNIIYDNGIEINIKVNEEHRRNGIATAISARLILRCLDKGLYPSWDAANMNSVKLAEKLGYNFDSEYCIYRIHQN